MSQTWIVTGTSSGFGQSMVKYLLSSGRKVAATLRKMDALDDLKEEYSDQLLTCYADMRDTESIRDAIKTTYETFGAIDAAVSNAGYGLFGAAEELTDQQLHDQITVNVIGSMQFIRGVLPIMREQRSGRIIQLSSMGGQISFPNLSLYHASKWAMEGFCEALAQEVACFGIGVTLAEPGGSQTDFGGRSAISAEPMLEYENTPVGEIRRKAIAGEWPTPGDPEKIAKAIVDSAEQHPAPLRLVLGSDSYEWMTSTLQQRLRDIEVQEHSALAVDVSPTREKS